MKRSCLRVRKSLLVHHGLSAFGEGRPKSFRSDTVAAIAGTFASLCEIPSDEVPKSTHRPLTHNIALKDFEECLP